MTGAGDPLRVLLVGYGRMGMLVEQLAEEYGVTIVGRLTRAAPAGANTLPDADVAIDFSAADAVVENAPRLAGHGLSLVIGTTGWTASEAQVRARRRRFPGRGHRRAQLRDWRERVFSDQRTCGGAARPSGVFSLDPRSASRREERRTFRYRSRPPGGRGDGRKAGGRVIDTGRAHPGHPHRRIRFDV